VAEAEDVQEGQEVPEAAEAPGTLEVEEGPEAAGDGGSGRERASGEVQEAEGAAGQEQEVEEEAGEAPVTRDDEGAVPGPEAAQLTGDRPPAVTDAMDADTMDAEELSEVREAPEATAASEATPAREGGRARGRIHADPAEIEAVIEAVLFVAAEPVSRSRLVELFDEGEREEAARALEAVLARYTGGEGRGVMVEEVGGGVRLVTRPELVGWLRRFFEVSGGSKLSMAALETLAIVAYRQPITSPEIQELRSVNSSGVLSTLLQRRLVRIAGRKEVVGKPFLYATTREFLVHFGLKSLKDLPPLEEFEEIFGEGSPAAGLETGMLPLGEGWGEDREERILQEAAALEEARDGEPEEGAAAEPRREVLAAETAVEISEDGPSAGEPLSGEGHEVNEVDEVEAEVP
jgi:segregation and condensation protein B